MTRPGHLLRRQVGFTSGVSGIRRFLRRLEIARKAYSREKNTRSIYMNRALLSCFPSPAHYCSGEFEDMVREMEQQRAPVELRVSVGEEPLHDKMHEDLTASAIRAAIRSRRLRLRIIKRVIEDLEAFQRIKKTECSLKRGRRKR